MTQSLNQDPEAESARALTALALQHELLAPGQTEIGDALWSYTMEVVTLCAQLADRAEAGDSSSGGDRIRAALLDLRGRRARAAASSDKLR